MFWIQAVHIDSGLKKSVQRSWRRHVLFQTQIFLRPNPPSDLGLVTESQATLALYLPSSDPFQRYAAYNEFIWLIHSTGRTKEAHQKLTTPEITELIICNLPANERYFAVQILIFDLIFCRRGSQLSRKSFFVFRGRPKYLMGRKP